MIAEVVYAVQQHNVVAPLKFSYFTDEMSSGAPTSPERQSVPWLHDMGRNGNGWMSHWFLGKWQN